MKGDGLRGQALRYLVIGGLNTLITYVIFIGLGLFLEAWIAYTLAFLVGLLWVVFGSSRLVFRASHSRARLLLFAVLYLVLYGLGRLLITWMDPSDGVALALTSLVILVVTTPLSFLGGRYLFNTNRTKEGS